MQGHAECPLPKKRLGMEPAWQCVIFCLVFSFVITFIIIHHIGPDGFGFSLCLKLYSIDIHQVANLQNFFGF